MLITIDPAEDAALFAQIAAAIRAAVVRGELRGGERLPSADELCAALDVNRHTVLHAYQALRDEGLIELRRGRGATLTARADSLRELSVHVEELVARAASLGISPDTLSRLIAEVTP